MVEKYIPTQATELAAAQNAAMLFNTLVAPPMPPEKERDKVKEQAQIQERMAEVGIRNMGAYMRKMERNGYVLQVDLAPMRELVSLQRRCSNNLNQVAIGGNTYGGIYSDEITGLQKDYADLWGPLSDLLEKLSGVVEL